MRIQLGDRRIEGVADRVTQNGLADRKVRSRNGSSRAAHCGRQCLRQRGGVGGHGDDTRVQRGARRTEVISDGGGSRDGGIERRMARMRALLQLEHHLHGRQE